MNQKTIQPGWCDGCNPDNCSGCATPTAPVDAGKYPELPEWSKRDDLGGLSPSEVRQALRTYVDADRAARVAAASKPQVKEARERRRWLSDSFNRGTQTLDEATVSARAMALSLATAPASIITASVMRDDGGEHPAFCLMVAYRTEKAAMAALAMLTDEPAQPAASAQACEYPPLVCDYCGALTPDPWHSSGMLHGKMSKHIHSCDSCAVEDEVQKQDEALIRQMLEALECSGEPDDPGHRCSHCDDYVDRNSVLRNAARKRLEGKP